VIGILIQPETIIMKTMQPLGTGLKLLSAVLLAGAITLTAYTPTATAGHGAAWGIGGLLAGSMLTSAHYRDKEERQKVYYAAPPPAAATTMTPEEKINQLNKLAAGGYITPEEYKAKKQAILNSL
jgi:hypothetical protein